MTSRVVAIAIAAASGAPMVSVNSIDVVAGQGILGDRYFGTRHRHVSVQSADALAEASERLGKTIGPLDTRRTITLSSGPVPAAPGSLIRIGSVVLEVVRIAAPCKIMNEVIGPGASAALRRRAGSVCRVLESGRIAVDDLANLGAGRPT